MTVTVSLNGNETNVSSLLKQASYMSSGGTATLTQWANNGHYYLYIPYIPSTSNNSSFLSWSKAYDNALSLKLGGMQGYLVTIAESGEQDYLSNLATSNVWAGATALGIYNTDGSVNKLSGNSIGNSTLEYVSGYFDIAKVYTNCGRTKGAESNTVNSSCVYSASPLTSYYYWAAGPETGHMLSEYTGGVKAKENEELIIEYYFPNETARIELNAWAQPENIIPSGTKLQTKNVYEKTTSKAGQYEDCTALYVGTTTGLNDIPEGNLNISSNQTVSSKGYIVEFGGWANHDSVDETLNKSFSFTLDETNKPKSCGVLVSKNGSDKIDITLNNILSDSRYYALLDKNGNVVTITSGTSSSNSWSTKNSDGTITYNGLVINNGPYKIVESTSNTSTPSTSDTQVEFIAITNYAGNNVSFYSDVDCASPIYFEIYRSNDYVSSTSRSYYLKVNDGYFYSSDPSITGTTITKISDGLYKVEYTISTTSNATLTAPDPEQSSSPSPTQSPSSNTSSGGSKRTEANTPCEEWNHSKNWTWSKSLGKCVYRVKNTSTN